MRIWIRADGNEQIASGHLRRCLTIAESLAGLGASPAFLLADWESEKMYRRVVGKEKIFPYYVLDVPYGRPMAEIPVLGGLYRKPARKISEPGALYGSPMREISVTGVNCGKLVRETSEPGVLYGSPMGEVSVPGVHYEKGVEKNPAVGKWGETSEAQHPDCQHPDWILVDSYAVTQDYFDALYEAFPATKIAYIDDLMRFDPDVDLVINYDPDVGELLKFYHKAKTQLLGPSYVPLRKQFREGGSGGEIESTAEIESGRKNILSGQKKASAKESNSRQKNSSKQIIALRILISTGGTDPYNMAGSLEEVVHSLAGGHRTIKECGMQEQVKVVATGYPYVSDMAGLMRDCDLAVSAAGTTLYELCAVGVPSISFSTADNQKVFAEKMDAAGLVTYAGDVRVEKGREMVLQKVKSWLQEQFLTFRTWTEEPSSQIIAEQTDQMKERQSSEIWTEQSFRMRSAVDGLGAERIAEAMIRKT